jgi:hypothetical protein
MPAGHGPPGIDRDHLCARLYSCEIADRQLAEIAIIGKDFLRNGLGALLVKRQDFEVEHCRAQPLPVEGDGIADDRSPPTRINLGRRGIRIGGGVGGEAGRRDKQHKQRPNEARNHDAESLRDTRAQSSIKRLPGYPADRDNSGLAAKLCKASAARQVT